MRRFQRLRPGSTLVELMIVMPVIATMLVITASWIHESLSLASALRQRQQYGLRQLALARQFRDDAHAATSARLDSAARLVMVIDDATDVAYEITAERVIRRTLTDSLRDETPAADVESYALPPGSDVRFDDAGLPEWAGLVIEHDRMPTAGRARPAVGQLHVTTRLGRWSHIAAAAWGTEEPDRMEGRDRTDREAASAVPESEAD